MHSGIQAIPVIMPTEQAPSNAPDAVMCELVKAGDVLLQLAERHKSSKHNALAEVCYLRALDIFSKALPSDHPKTAATREQLASLYRARGQISVAESLQRTALADLRRHYGDTPDAQVAAAVRNLAETCLLAGRIQEGLKLLSEALQMTRELADHDEHVVEISKYHAQVMARLG